MASAGTASCLAVDVDLCILIGNRVETVKLQGATGDIDSARKMARCKFRRIADVKEDGLFLRINGGLGGLGGNLFIDALAVSSIALTLGFMGAGAGASADIATWTVEKSSANPTITTNTFLDIIDCLLLLN